jgi:hypothetical protein
MAFHRVDEVPQLNLAHLTGTSTTVYWGSRSTTTTYQVRPLGLRRPADGQARHGVGCPACGKTVQVLVPGARLTRRRQRYWLAPTVLLLGLVLLGIVYAVLWYPWRENPLGFVLPLAGMVFALGGGLSCLAQARTAHGIRVPARQPGRAARGHSIRHPPRLGAKYRYQARRQARRQVGQQRGVGR